MKKIALIGDSIFDNARYVDPNQAVIDHIRRLEKNDWSAELLAVDGNVVQDVIDITGPMLNNFTHFVISCGGNDALQHIGYFFEPASSVAEVMNFFADKKDKFSSSYRMMLDRLTELNRPFSVCTIYDSSPSVGGAELAALSIFNEVILKEAFRLGIPVIDLRLVCDEPTDYAMISPIEPSETGGLKIAKAIQKFIQSHNFNEPKSKVYF